jgi:hypothetical protein
MLVGALHDFEFYPKLQRSRKFTEHSQYCTLVARIQSGTFYLDVSATSIFSLTKVQVSAPFQADFDSKLPLSEWEFWGMGMD